MGAVHIETSHRSTGSPVVGVGTKVSFGGFENLANCCRKATINIEAGKAVTADLELFATFKGDAEHLRLFMKNPLTRKMEEVKRVEFADGTVIDTAAGGRPVPVENMVAAINRSNDGE